MCANAEDISFQLELNGNRLAFLFIIFVTMFFSLWLVARTCKYICRIRLYFLQFNVNCVKLNRHLSYFTQLCSLSSFRCSGCFPRFRSCFDFISSLLSWHANSGPPISLLQVEYGNWSLFDQTVAHSCVTPYFDKVIVPSNKARTYTEVIHFFR